jgi:hypothetical protein
MSTPTPKARPVLASVLVPAALAAIVLTTFPRGAAANERHFTFTYESGTLPEQAKELEVWTTPRLGRGRFFAQFDQRLEFEVGITDRLMTAFYLNFSSTNQTVFDPATMTKQRQQSFDFGGVSSEWKYKLSDPVADAFGFALYGELLVAPTETELETKLIFDKQVGDFLLAANLVSEIDLELTNVKETEPEFKFEADVAAGYRVRPGVFLGLEARSETLVEEEELVNSALFVGPVLAYATKGWWAAFTVTPQLPALKSEAGSRDLIDHEALTARLLFSFHLD